MKKTLLIILLFVSLSGFSQKNAIKVGLLGVNYGDMALGYERVINDKSTINFNIGYWDMKTGILNPTMFFDEGKGVWLDEVNNGFHSALEYRFYMGKKGVMKGFYMAPYLRYWNYSMVLADIISNSNVDNVTFDAATKFSSIGLGMQMGFQWIIYDHISIDFYFFGAGVEKLNMKTTYVARDHNNFDYNLIEDDVKGVFSDIKILKNNLKTEVTPDNLKAKLPVWIPGIRGGFTIGYAF